MSFRRLSDYVRAGVPEMGMRLKMEKGLKKRLI
jgi:hypothetical protein